MKIILSIIGIFFTFIGIFIGIFFIFYFSIICLILFLPTKEYNMSYTINEDFIIQKVGILEDDKVELLSSDFDNENHERACGLVDKFVNVGDYYIGHFDGSNSKIKRCSGYFYIKKDNSDVKFGISELEIKKKFGEIDYQYMPYEYINKYGETK